MGTAFKNILFNNNLDLIPQIYVPEFRAYRNIFI